MARFGTIDRTTGTGRAGVRNAMMRNGVVAALDIGSSKVACFIAQAGAQGPAARLNSSGPLPIQVVGIGHQMCQGMRSGTVVDMEATAAAIRMAVENAERMSAEKIDRVVVNLSAGKIASHAVSVQVDVAGHDITDMDLARVIRAARAKARPEGRDIIHAIPTGYAIDGQAGIRDPRGMFGERLGVGLHVVTANPAPMRNLVSAVDLAHLKISGIAASAYASGLGTLVEDEMDLGVTCIDMGGGTTSIAVFFEGSLVYTDVVPVGGNHVTSDIAQGLSTPLIAAERMKTLFGSATAGPDDHRDMIDVPQIGDDGSGGTYHIPRSMLAGVIAPRIEETFEMVRDRMRAAGIDRLAGRSVVLTGGASQLAGVSEIAERVLGKQIRLGRPVRLTGLAEATGGPAFATCAGLLAYAVNGPLEAVEREVEADAAPARGGIGRIVGWLRENF